VAANTSRRRVFKDGGTVFTASWGRVAAVVSFPFYRPAGDAAYVVLYLKVDPADPRA